MHTLVLMECLLTVLVVVFSCTAAKILNDHFTE